MRLPLNVYTYGAVVLALLGVVYWALWTAGDRDRANRRADAYEAQSDLNAGATEAVERVLKTETVVRIEAEEATRNVEAAEDAAAVLDAHVAGIGRMREATAAGPDPRP